MLNTKTLGISNALRMF